ncbi:hypothetical protein AAGT95_02835 [Salinicola lusitanus]|uniref:Uncharacterized protein n=1 Tax=Salinicola lusitanus TaxID=1949085 RepID=A0ABZ3CUX8_9GAMM
MVASPLPVATGCPPMLLTAMLIDRLARHRRYPLPATRYPLPATRYPLPVALAEGW